MAFIHLQNLHSMKTNLINKVRKAFTVIPNELIQDGTITPEARCLFCYMASKPDDWTFMHEELMKNMKWSDKTLAKYVKELLETGWHSRVERRTAEGTFNGWDYYLHDRPEKTSGRQKFPSGKNSDHTKKEPSLLHAHTRKDELPWFESPQERRDKAVEAIFSAMRENPLLWKEIADKALNSLQKPAFIHELQLWSSHYANDRAIMMNPVASLTTGRGSFLAWLSQSFCRDKYKAENPAIKPAYVKKEEQPVVRYRRG